MVIRNIFSEFTDDLNTIVRINRKMVYFQLLINCFLQPESKSILPKLLVKFPPEIDASQLQKILKSHWKNYLSEKPSLELCKSLIMLRDFNISGRINLMDIPILMQMLQFWKVNVLLFLLII